MLANRADKKWAPILGRQVLPAVIVGAGRKVLAANAAFRVRFTGGEDPTGRFCFEIVHQSRPPCEGASCRCPLEPVSSKATPAVHRHLTCLGVTYDQVTARRLTHDDGEPGCFLLVCRPLAPIPYSRFLVGSSPAVLSLVERVEQLAAGDFAVVIRGESGTGKVCVGRLLHDLSRRSKGPFVPIDCSELGGSRFQRELLPRQAGAGERATWDGGLIAAAAGGSLLLLEPQQLAPSLQSRVGCLVDKGPPQAESCRWLFAIDEATGSPRGSLAATLSAAPSILVPPLRDRREDLPVLLDGLARRFAGAETLVVDPTVLEMLAGYLFPGNLRELECLVERACLIAGSGSLRPEHFPAHVTRG